MILDQNVEQRFHNINSDPVSTHWNLVSTHTHAMRLTQNETRNINFQFGTWFKYQSSGNTGFNLQFEKSQLSAPSKLQWS